MTEPILQIENLHGWYDESHVLHGVTLEARRGETVALIGRNGAGKTSTLRAAMNLLGRREGSIRVNGRETIGMPRHKVAYTGLGYVPEERGIFASLSVQENLMLLPSIGENGMSVARIYEIFPNLRERRRAAAGTLSGGEQQMLAMARVLRTGPQLLLLDEPTEGLAPVIVKAIGSLLAQLKADGMTMLLVEQNFHFARRLADRFYLIENGRITDHFDREGLEAHADRVADVVGV
ncbi:branched-chain amino acid transport system ATP-binding protein [Limimaricola variabilis]|uniref:Branched-chain amino acid transport system ATP-binding protein n=1 Tax=Limimaricola variabilis TaxID=1492771 RepID=A0ABR6HIZ3_9RHOB|nr:ABC transporter ATP-binding protein [Limimaricola variabilis]MBB3710514.1 branched-chain amino acid transport system ATP-binding protein [Limimaricola variabilis]